MSATKSETAAPGLLLCDDLMFTSRITGTARAANLSLFAARTVAEFVSTAGWMRPTWVIIDLDFPMLKLDEVLRELKEACHAMPRVAAYGSHVDAAGLRAARDAGCEPVLPRSKFVEDLASLLPGLAK
jgi:hypothetical protein